MKDFNFLLAFAEGSELLHYDPLSIWRLLLDFNKMEKRANNDDFIMNEKEKKMYFLRLKMGKKWTILEMHRPTFYVYKNFMTKEEEEE